MGGEEAGELLASEGLQAGAVDSISHPETPPGRILGQSPLPGQLAFPGGAIALTFSLGPERRPVPDVTELRVPQATALLEASGFEVTLDSIESEVTQGRVASIFPEGGVMLPLPARVLVSVSLGPPLIAMPALVGLAEEEALLLLDSLGLAVGEVATRFRFGFNQGEVLEHFPPPDSLVAEGTEVRLVIGRRVFSPNEEGAGPIMKKKASNYPYLLAGLGACALIAAAWLAGTGSRSSPSARGRRPPTFRRRGWMGRPVRLPTTRARSCSSTSGRRGARRAGSRCPRWSGYTGRWRARTSRLWR